MVLSAPPFALSASVQNTLCLFLFGLSNGHQVCTVIPFLERANTGECRRALQRLHTARPSNVVFPLLVSLVARFLTRDYRVGSCGVLWDRFERICCPPFVHSVDLMIIGHNMWESGRQAVLFLMGLFTGGLGGDMLACKFSWKSSLFVEEQSGL